MIEAPEKKMAFKKLLAMGKEKMEIVDHLLVKGESAKGVAKMIQQEWKLHTKTTEGSLTKQLERYRRAHISKLSVFTAATDPEEKRVILKRVNTQLDIMQELTELIEVQKERVLMAIDKERTVKMPFSWLRKDIDSLSLLLGQLAEHQFKLGILHEMPKTTLIQSDGAGTTLVQSTSGVPITSHEQNLKIGKQTADAAKDFLRLVAMSADELLHEQEAIEAEFTHADTGKNNASV